MLEWNRIYNMDCFDGLRMIDDESINCVITSPPYYRLRNYEVNILQEIHGTDPYGTWRNYNVTVTEVIPDSPRIVIESFNAG